MDVPIVVALITGICAVVGQWLISRQSVKQKKTADAVRDARLHDRLAGVEKRLDEHNSYASRFNEIQTDIAVIKTELKNLKESQSTTQG